MGSGGGVPPLPPLPPQLPAVTCLPGSGGLSPCPPSSWRPRVRIRGASSDGPVCVPSVPHPPAGHRRGAGSRRGGGAGSPHLLSCKHCLGAPELARCLAWAGQPSTSRAGCATGTVRPFAPRGGGTGLGAPRLATWKSNGVSSRGSRHRRGLGGSPHLGFSGYHGVGGDSQGATRGYRGGRGCSACSAPMPQGRVSGSLVQSQLSLSHRAVVRNAGCWCRQHDLT